jgi:hypothetical protein
LAISKAVRARRKKDIDIILESPAIEYHLCDGQARDFLHQNRDIKEQESGVELALKLPQIVSITTTPAAAKISLLRL